MGLHLFCSVSLKLVGSWITKALLIFLKQDSCGSIDVATVVFLLTVGMVFRESKKKIVQRETRTQKKKPHNIIDDFWPKYTE